MDSHFDRIITNSHTVTISTSLANCHLLDTVWMYTADDPIILYNLAHCHVRINAYRNLSVAFNFIQYHRFANGVTILNQSLIHIILKKYNINFKEENSNEHT